MRFKTGERYRLRNPYAEIQTLWFWISWLLFAASLPLLWYAPNVLDPTPKWIIINGVFIVLCSLALLGTFERASDPELNFADVGLNKVRISLASRWGVADHVIDIAIHHIDSVGIAEKGVGGFDYWLLEYLYSELAPRGQHVELRLRKRTDLLQSWPWWMRVGRPFRWTSVVRLDVVEAERFVAHLQEKLAQG